MKRIILTLTIMGLMGAFAIVSLGQITPRSDKCQKAQKHRVKSGVKSGEITRREAKSIKHSYKSAKRYERRAKSDGKVTWKERSRLQHKMNKTSRKVYRTKHNKHL